MMSRACGPLVVTGTSLTRTEENDDLAAWASPKMSAEGVRDEQSNPWSSLPPPPTQVQIGSHPPPPPHTNRGYKVPSATSKRPSSVSSRQGSRQSPEKGFLRRPAHSAASTGSSSHPAKAAQPPADRDRRKTALAKVNEKIAGTARVATAASRASPQRTQDCRMLASSAPPVRWSVTGKAKAKAAQHTKALKGTRSSARDSSTPREGKQKAGKTTRTEKGDGSATSAEPAAAHNVLDGDGEVRAILDRLRQGANDETLPQKSAAGAGTGTAEAGMSRPEALAPAAVWKATRAHHGETHEATPPQTTPSRATSPPQPCPTHSDDAYGDGSGPMAGVRAAPAAARGTTERWEVPWADTVAEMEVQQPHEVQRMVQELGLSLEAVEADRERMRRAELLRQEISRHADANQQRLLDTYRERSEPLLTFMRDLKDKIASMGSIYERAHAKYVELQRTYVEQAARLTEESAKQTQALCTAHCGGCERAESIPLAASDKQRDGTS